MAERRMFAKTIIDSDAFLDMPTMSQLLYFHLSMRADDEGFVNKPRAIMRTIGAREDDAKILVEKKFIIPFDSGVVVIKHWRIHNYIRGDRMTPTKYCEERSELDFDSNGAYTQNDASCLPSDGQVTDICPTDGSERLTQVRLGKVSIGKDSIDKESNNITNSYSDGGKSGANAPHKSTSKFVKPTIQEIEAYCIERNNNVNAERFFDYYESNGWCVGKSKMKDWKAAVRNWEKNGYNNSGNRTSSEPLIYDSEGFLIDTDGSRVV